MLASRRWRCRLRFLKVPKRQNKAFTNTHRYRSRRLGNVPTFPLLCLSYKKRPENSEQLTSVQLIASAIRCSHREIDFIGESHFGLHLIFTGSLMLLDQFTFGNKESWLKFCFPFRNFHKRSFKILKDLKRTNVCFIVHIIHTLR